jgi:hypothetical protein
VAAPGDTIQPPAGSQSVQTASTPGVTTPPPAAEVQPAQQPAAGETPAEPEAWRDSERLALPIPPAPPGERGYRPGAVEQFLQLLDAILDQPDSHKLDELARLELTRTFSAGQGYHAGAVDALRRVWLDELARRSL